MKFQIILSYALLMTTLLMGCCLAEDNSIGKEPMKEKMLNTSTTYNTTSESNMTVPIIIIVEEEEDNSMRTQYDSDEDYSARDLNWVVVKKVTNITVVKESSVDPETKKTKDVVIENRAEEYRMFHDDRRRKVLTEKDINSMPFPMRFF